MAAAFCTALFYALPPTMTSPDGVPTNAVYGFLRMLLSLYRELDPAYVAVTFDKDRQTFRMEMYDGYKATRKPAPAELVPQFDLILEVMHVMGVAVYSLSGYEATMSWARFLHAMKRNCLSLS